MLMMVLALVVSSTASAADNNDGQKGQIAILVNSLDNPYYAAEAKAAKRKAQSLGYSTLVLSHNEDVNRQHQLITSVVAKGVEGIVLDNAGSQASVSAVRYAKQHGVPVVLINREIPEDGIAIAQLSHNNVQAASQVAHKFVQKLGEKGKYVELTCNLADNNCVARSKAFHRVLDQYPDLKMVARQDANGALLDAKEIMDSILQEHPDIDGVICGNGPVALGAIASLQNAGKDDVIVAGMDGSNEEIEAIKSGKLYATAMLQAQKIARVGVSELDKYLRTGSTGRPERQLFRGILITKDNADKVHDFSYGKK
ncbi:D-ribose ABC transporter substrate-binding protein [Salinisphaera sp.]|uniref:D-ribose ABC transporter substrate-binding protein n=1 Tax=Salinisphaera sp. TaxID=1914330 RepID=UPI0039C923ED